MNTLYATNHWKIHGASTLSSITLSTFIGCLDFVFWNCRWGYWNYPYSLF